MKELYFLAGLPRSGSTLLTSILYQNPTIHTEGHSALCNVMWDTQMSLENNPHLKATGREHTKADIMSMLPKAYYAQQERDIVLDKSFTWTLSGNIEMIQKYITPAPKFIVMERTIDEIVNSFLGLMERSDSNGVFDISNFTGTLQERREQAIRAEGGSLHADIRAYNNAKDHSDQSMFHYVSYKDLVEKTQETIDGIYTFLGLPLFDHDLGNIENLHTEDDTVWGFKDMHTIRPVISYRGNS